MVKIKSASQETFAPPDQKLGNRALDHLPRAERYLYQLFSLIGTGHLTVINPEGQEFHFGTPGSTPTLRLIIRNPKTYDRILAFGTLGFCEA
jgi:cyclopropane-fatty-acyl-phospholipid synthase